MIKIIKLTLFVGFFAFCLVSSFDTEQVAVKNVIATPSSYEDIGDIQDKEVHLRVDQGTLVKVSVPASAVFVADPSVADVQVKTPRLIYIYGRSPGTTSLYAVDENENILMNREITVKFETVRLQQAITQMLPGSKIKVDALNDTVVLRGTVSNATDAADAVSFAQRFVGSSNTVVNQLKINGANQINLQVVIAEMSRTTLKDLGVNWDLASTAGNFVFGLATGNVSAVGTSFVTRSGGTNNLGFGYSSGSTTVTSLIDALEEEGLIKVMAKPNLTALSGETASFLAGGEFPVPVAQEDNQVTIEFREYGVSLAFTPTLTNSNRISLRVRPEVSQLTNTGSIQNGNLVVPALSTRRAETTVEMGSGQSFAIAGLMQQNITQDNTSVPGVNEIPGVGSLFQSDQIDKTETELVIIVTPYIVQPTNDKLSTPVDGYQPAHDKDRYLNRALYKRKTATPDTRKIIKKPRREVKNVGFEME